MAKFGSGVKYGDGTKYANVDILPTYFMTLIDDGDQHAQHHYIGLIIKHAGSERFAIHDIRLVAARGPIEKLQYTVNVDRDGWNRVGLIIKHSNPTEFRVDHIRVHGAIKQQRAVK